MDEHRDEIFSCLEDFKCLRTKTHKVIVSQDDAVHVELYDLVNDPDETTNIRDDNRDICGPLRSRIQARLTQAKGMR